LHCCILQKLGAACTQVRRLWIWIYSWISMDISIDIYGQSVDMDMDVDEKFYIHGKPKENTVHRSSRRQKNVEVDEGLLGIRKLRLKCFRQSIGNGEDAYR